MSLQVKSSDEAVILCKTAIGALKLNIGDLQVTKVRAGLGWGVLGAVTFLGYPSSWPRGACELTRMWELLRVTCGGVT